MFINNPSAVPSHNDKNPNRNSYGDMMNTCGDCAKFAQERMYCNAWHRTITQQSQIWKGCSYKSPRRAVTNYRATQD